MSETVLVAGINGMMGSLIAHALLDRGAKVYGSVRSLDRAADAVQPLQDRGVKVFEADVTKPETLTNLKGLGTTVVVSCLQGGPEVIVDGQKSLAEALADDGGLRRFITSTFTMTMTHVPKDEHPFLAVRKTFDYEVAPIIEKEKGVKFVHIFNGCYMDKGVFWGFLGVFDKTEKKLSYYGKDTQKFDLTTTADSAQYTAEAALDSDSPQEVQVCGERLSVKEIAAVYKDVKGEELKLECLGTTNDLRARIEKAKADQPTNVMAWVPLCYQLPMMDGRGALGALHNERYPGVKVTTLRDYLKDVDVAK